MDFCELSTDAALGLSWQIHQSTATECLEDNLVAINANQYILTNIITLLLLSSLTETNVGLTKADDSE